MCKVNLIPHGKGVLKDIEAKIFAFWTRFLCVSTEFNLFYHHTCIHPVIFLQKYVIYRIPDS